MKRLPFIKADVIKWPRHAHRFDDNERTDNIIRKLNDVVKPWFIIWQAHPAQDMEKFRDYIKHFDFHDKFLSSDEREIEFVSLLDLPDTRGMS
jgi:hypothetical protein